MSTRMRTQSSTADQTHKINSRYDNQHSYGPHQSYYGDGKYPPDWDVRRDAVWERQKYQCGRCGIYKGDASISEVHHIVHLSQGGSNSLKNLVGLCGDCHAVMHPTVDVMNGNANQAEMFPNVYADDRVSVIRKPNGNDELEYDVERLSEFSEPSVNNNAVTKITIPTSPKIARQAGQSLHKLLLDHGYVPRTSSYHGISVHSKPVDLLAAIYPQGIELTARSDGTALEVDEAGSGSNAVDVYYSEDSNHSEIEVTEPTGITSKRELNLNHRTGSRLRFDKPFHAPPLTPATAPDYAVGATKYFGWQSLKIGAIPGIILAFVLPSFVPFGGSLFGILIFIFIIGLVIRSPSIYKDATNTPVERVINKRNE